MAKRQPLLVTPNERTLLRDVMRAILNLRGGGGVNAHFMRGMGLTITAAGGRRGELGSAGTVVRRLRVSAIYDNHLECVSWNGTTAGTDVVVVAKPWELRHDAGFYQGVTTWINLTEQTAQASDGTITENLTTRPLYIAATTEILAVRAKTGVLVGSDEATWIDLNVAGRQWLAG